MEAKMSKSYKDAVTLLRTRSRTWLAKDPNRSIKNRANVFNMKEWLDKLGHKNPSDLNVIHITGTKGKGSTAAFVDSLVRAHYMRRSRHVSVGLYTSPHLVTERERIRINFRPLSERVFAQYFFEVWEALGKTTDPEDMPGYLQLLCLVSVHAFSKEGVDLAIYEVHAGGRKDATNIFERPIATGFAMIGLDHADLLGTTIQEITSHKAGIMKSGAKSFSIVQQNLSATEGLEKHANKLKCPLQFVAINESLPAHSNLLLVPQKQNASLAIPLANVFLERAQEQQLDQKDIKDGIAQCRWPGRFEEICQGEKHWFLDAAHNCLSLPVALEWYKTRISQDVVSQRRILIYGHESVREPHDLMNAVVRFCEDQSFPFDAIFLTPYRRYSLLVNSSKIQEQVTQWQSLLPKIQVTCTASLQDAMKEVGQEPARILVTGSTFLVGEALTLLDCENRALK